MIESTASNRRDATRSQLALARQHQAAMRAAGVVAQRLNPQERASAHPQSLRFAVDAKCWDCEGGDDDPNVQWRIGNCVCPGCPLYPVRPHRHLAGKPTPRNSAK